MEQSYVLKVSEPKFLDLDFAFCGYAQCQAGHQFGPATRPHYILHIVLEGYGIYQVGTRTYQIGPGQGFLIEPEVSTHYRADYKDPWSYCWVGFTGQAVPAYLSEMGLEKNRVVFPCTQVRRFKEIVFQMLSLSESTLENRYKLQACLFDFLSLLCKSLGVTDEEGQTGDALLCHNPLVDRALEYIKTAYSHPLTVTQIAKQIGVDRSYLHNLFKKHLEISPHQFLTKFRVSRAAELLDLTELSVNQISYSCGYTDPLIFTRAFKRVKGCTPTQYRTNRRLPS